MTTPAEYERDRAVVEALRDLSSAVGLVRSAAVRVRRERRAARARLAEAEEGVLVAMDDLCDAIGATRPHRPETYMGEAQLFEVTP